MDWKPLLSDEQLNDLIKESHDKPQVIFKHSIRCSISSMIKNRLEKSEAPGGFDFHYLDLIKYRPLSNKIAEEFNIRHESPQVIIIKDGHPVYDESHSAIHMEEIADAVQ